MWPIQFAFRLRISCRIFHVGNHWLFQGKQTGIFITLFCKNYKHKGKSTKIEREKTIKGEIYVLLTVHLVIIFVNNQLDSQFFFIYVYFYSLHDSGSHVPITRRIYCINTTSGTCHSCIDDHLVCRFG